MAKLSDAGGETGEPSTSCAAVNDDKRAQSRGTITTIDHRTRTTWEMTAARRSLGSGAPMTAVSSRFRADVAVVAASAVTAGLRSHDRRPGGTRGTPGPRRSA